MPAPQKKWRPSGSAGAWEPSAPAPEWNIQTWCGNWFTTQDNALNHVDRQSKPFTIPNDDVPEDTFFDTQRNSLKWSPAAGAAPKQMAKPPTHFTTPLTTDQTTAQGSANPKGGQGDREWGFGLKLPGDPAQRENRGVGPYSGSQAHRDEPGSADSTSGNIDPATTAAAASEADDLLAMYLRPECRAVLREMPTKNKDFWLDQLVSLLDTNDPNHMLSIIRRSTDDPSFIKDAEEAAERFQWTAPLIPKECREGLNYHRLYHWLASRHPVFRNIPAFYPERTAQVVQGRSVSVFGQHHEMTLQSHPPSYRLMSATCLNALLFLH